MASYSKLPSGKWRAQVARNGIRKTKAFPTKQQARDWASRIESEILRYDTGGSKAPLSEVFDRYGREVSVTKRGFRWEVIRLDRILRELGDKPVRDIQASDIAAWRDDRLRHVKPGTVRREMNLLSSVFTHARKEWGLLSLNPMRDVKKPASPPHRDRIATDKEMEALALTAGDDMTTVKRRALQAFLFAIETGMRAGEIVGLTRDHINGRVAHLPETKNGSARDVPLSKEAMRLLGELPDTDPVFGLDARQLDVNWRALRDKAGVGDLTFHDSRHMGITKLAQKLEVLDLARTVGHRDIRMLMTYYHPTAEDLAKKLD